MNTKNNVARRVLPIAFSKLEAGSMFRIFAEPTRGIAKSNDSRVYQKICEAYSEDTASAGKAGERERAIILYPDDRVIPLTRPSNRKN